LHAIDNSGITALGRFEVALMIAGKRNQHFWLQQEIVNNQYANLFRQLVNVDYQLRVNVQP
jgi:hypothetical protein